jgi:hypothetical protein
MEDLGKIEIQTENGVTRDFELVNSAEVYLYGMAFLTDCGNI